MRDGRLVATVDAAGMTKRQLASLMVGREVLFRHEKPPAQLGEERLMVHEIDALDDKGLVALRNLSLSVRSGEIVGIAGVAGNGQRELAEVICGLRHVESGAVEVTKNPVTNSPPIVVIEAGIAYIPEDRSATGSAPNLSVAENLALKNYRKPKIGGLLFLSRR